MSLLNWWTLGQGHLDFVVRHRRDRILTLTKELAKRIVWYFWDLEENKDVSDQFSLVCAVER